MKSLVARTLAVLATNPQHGVGELLCPQFAMTCCEEQQGFGKACRPAVLCLRELRAGHGPRAKVWRPLL